mmetsp:Transcript_10256/g.31837  ORF Transcript_10256/g.31837 Transcript_10256/m.31837 type:complete len:297 (+) Transcript_10256:295-1185(+)
MTGHRKAGGCPHIAALQTAQGAELLFMSSSAANAASFGGRPASMYSAYRALNIDCMCSLPAAAAGLASAGADVALLDGFAPAAGSACAASAATVASGVFTATGDLPARTAVTASLGESPAATCSATFAFTIACARSRLSSALGTESALGAGGAGCVLVTAGAPAGATLARPFSESSSACALAVGLAPSSPRCSRHWASPLVRPTCSSALGPAFTASPPASSLSSCSALRCSTPRRAAAASSGNIETALSRANSLMATSACLSCCSVNSLRRVSSSSNFLVYLRVTSSTLSRAYAMQ